MKNKDLMNCFFRALLFCALVLGSANFANSQNVPVKLSTNKVVIGGETYILHLVKEKQTLFSIAKAYEVDLSVLMKVNKKSQATVNVGEVLRIPTDLPKTAVAPKIIKKEDADYIYHIVKRGDTLFSLYRKYGVKTDEIRKANPGITNNLTLGEVVKVPKSGSKQQQVREEVKSQVPQHDKKYYYYVIKAGDTESSIARQFFMKLKKFRKINPKIRRKVLQPGDWVRIPRYLVPPEYFVVKETPKDTIQEEVVVQDSIVEEEVFVEQTVQKDITIGLFLPLYLETNDTINQIVSYQDTLEIITERDPRVIFSKSRNFLRFYQGVLMAVDSLQREGLNINLHVFDTEKDANKLRQTASRIRYQKFDFFIGPVYQHTFSVIADLAQEMRIPIISPLSAKNKDLKTNPFVVQINTTLENICSDISEYACEDFEYKNVVVVHPERYKHYGEYKVVTDIERELFEGGKYWENDKLNYKKISFDKHELFGIEHVLCDSCENIIVLPIDNQPMVENIITNLNVLSQRFAIRLLGFSKWQRYNSLDAEVFYNLNFTVFSPYYKDYKSEVINHFVESYREKFLCEPNDFSFSGYDICRYFSLATSKLGSGFTESLDQIKVDLLQSGYHFHRVGAFGGLENKGVHLINYSRDYKVRHHIITPEKEVEEVDIIEKSFEY